MPRIIIWHKWKDPVAPLVLNRDRDEDADEDELEAVHARASRDSFSDDKDIEYDRDKKATNEKFGPVLVGPMGIIPLNEENIPSRLWKFWMGHTNFRITQSVLDAVEAVDGVEAINVFSPYRMRIAVATAFASRDVRRAIDAVFADPPARAARPAASGLAAMKLLAARHKHWAIVKGVDGKHKTFGGDGLEEVKAAAAASGGEEVAASW